MDLSKCFNFIRVYKTKRGHKKQNDLIRWMDENEETIFFVIKFDSKKEEKSQIF